MSQNPLSRRPESSPAAEPRSITTRFGALYSGLAQGSLEHVVRAGGERAHLSRRLKQLARHCGAISHPTFYFSVSLASIIGSLTGALRPLDFSGWTVMGVLVIPGILGLLMAVSYFRHHYHNAGLDTLIDPLRHTSRDTHHHADELFQCLARLAPFATDQTPVTLELTPRGFSLSLHGDGHRALLLERYGDALRLHAGTHTPLERTIPAGDTEALAHDLADLLHTTLTTRRQTAALEHTDHARPIRLLPDTRYEEPAQHDEHAALAHILPSSVWNPRLHRVHTSPTLALSSYAGIATAWGAGIVALLTSGSHALTFLGLTLGFLSALTVIPSLFVTLPPLPRLRRRRPIPVSVDAPAALVLDGARLRLDTHCEGIDLSEPFSATLTRHPDTDPLGRTLVTIQLTQGEPRAPTRLAFSVVTFASPAVDELPSYASDAHILDGDDALRRHLWPLLRAASRANGELIALRAT